MSIQTKQVKITVTAELAIAFKEACIASKVSMAETLSRFMSEYSKTTVQEPSSLPDYTTKRQRRAAVKKIIKQLEQIMASEERCRDNIPENLQGSIVFENAEESVTCYEEAIESLSSL